MSQTLSPAELTATYIDGWNAASDAREQLRRSPYGFRSYAGSFLLGAEPESFDGIPGRWNTGPDGPRVELAAGEELLIDGEVVTTSQHFTPVQERELRRAARFGDVVLELSKRGGQDLLRPIDPAHGRELNDDYDHTPAYAPDPRWLVEGRFVPFESFRPTPLGATVGDIVHVHPAAGEAVFTIDGTEQRLLVIARDGRQPGAAGTGLALFTGGTSGSTTDPLGRSLPIEFPAEAGPVALDFNVTQNLQRPYTRVRPLPLSPAQNRVTVPSEAGEQLPVFMR